MNSDLDLTIIIPEYNTKDILSQCLRSIFLQTKKINFEVIVVDNASNDGSFTMVKKHFPLVRIIRNNKNLGFAKANNQALKLSRGKYILFLNSDTIILNRAIEGSLKFIKNTNEASILGCQLLDQTGKIQPSGGFFPTLGRVFNWMFFIDNLAVISKIIKPYQQTRLDFFKKIQTCDWLTGAYLMVKKQVIKAIQGFDEKFFMYSEEIDFCYRAKKAGFKVYFYPGAQVVHLKGKSSQEGFKEAVLGEYLGIKKFFYKHKAKWQLSLLKLFLRGGALLRILIFGILKKDQQKEEIYEKAFKLV